MMFTFDVRTQMTSSINRCAYLLLLVVLLSTPILTQANTTELVVIPLPYWYTCDTFDLNPYDSWIPFYSLTDVPYSLPLRGFNSQSRSYFIDLGAHEWLSEWIEFRYNWPIPDYEKEFDDTNAVDQLEYIFELMTGRLSRPYSYVDESRRHVPIDYVKDLEGTFEAFVPLVVMYGLNETYDERSMREWVVHPTLIEECLDESFPLIDWKVELFWFNYDNATGFANLMEEKTLGVDIMMDDDFFTRCDNILYDIDSSDSKYYECDFVFPSLVMVQDYNLYSVFYGMRVGGLGRIPSSHIKINSWNLNGRSMESFFYGGDPTKPRASLTRTVLHEIGHCIGQADIHSAFGWIGASTTVSLMAAYSNTLDYDCLDRDLINIGQALQLWGRYQNEIDYFESFSPDESQLTSMQTLEANLSRVPEMLITNDFDFLKSMFQNAETLFDQISTQMYVPRKATGWSERSPALDIHIDWIIGPGFPEAEAYIESLQSEIETERQQVSVNYTSLPAPLYNISIHLNSTDDNYNNALLGFWSSNLVGSQTSDFDSDEVPEDAFDSFPRNRIFQNISGYAIDGNVVEQWLVDNPYTSQDENTIHYRFYIFNLENLTIYEDDILPTLIVVVGVGSGATILIAAVFYVKRRRK